MKIRSIGSSPLYFDGAFSRRELFGESPDTPAVSLEASRPHEYGGREAQAISLSDDVRVPEDAADLNTGCPVRRRCQSIFAYMAPRTDDPSSIPAGCHPTKAVVWWITSRTSLPWRAQATSALASTCFRGREVRSGSPIRSRRCKPTIGPQPERRADDLFARLPGAAAIRSGERAWRGRLLRGGGGCWDLR